MGRAAEADDGELSLERDVSESGSVTVPWYVEGHGLLALSTSTLVERWDPYHLPLELARGTLNAFRTQLYEWQSIGLAVPDEAYARLKEAMSKFSGAVVQQRRRDGGRGGPGCPAHRLGRLTTHGGGLCRAGDRRSPPGDRPFAVAPGRHAQ